MTKIIFLFTLWFISLFAQAHPGGHGPEKILRCEIPETCTAEEALNASQLILNFMVENQQLPSHWFEAKKDTQAKEILFKDTAGFAVRFVNLNEPIERQNLFILLSIDGQALGASFEKDQFTEISSSSKWTGFFIILILTALVFIFFLKKPNRKNQKTE